MNLNGLRWAENQTFGATRYAATDMVAMCVPFSCKRLAPDGIPKGLLVHTPVATPASAAAPARAPAVGFACISVSVSAVVSGTLTNQAHVLLPVAPR